MSRYTIDFSPLRTVMRHSIDMAVHESCERFKDELGDQIGLTQRIAQAAAETAVEQFTTYCNAQLRMIEIDHEERVKQPFFLADDPK